MRDILKSISSAPVIRGNNSLIQLAGNNGKLSTALQLAGVVQQVWQQIDTWKVRHRDRQIYSIVVGDKDLLYAELHEWLLRRVPPSEQRSLTAKTAYNQTWDDEGNPLGKDKIRVRYYYGGRRNLTVDLDGYRIEVGMEKPEQEEEEGGRRMTRLSEDKIIFTMRSQGAQAAVMRLLEAIAQKQKRPEVPKVLIANKWGDWVSAKQLAKRDPSTVVLAAGQMEELSAVLERFLESEMDYAMLGQPWHYGMLLHGPPGTGKSSAAMALALLHKLDVYYLPLGDMESDTDLIQLLTRITDRSVLLIEDADTYRAAVDREQTKDDLIPPKLSSSGLLNVLDGVVTPHGMITIITTNKLDQLDPALIRSGRCDTVMEIGYLTDEQLARLVTVMTGKHGPLPSLGGRQIAAADITRCVRTNINDKSAAYAAIIDFLMNQIPQGVAA